MIERCRICNCRLHRSGDYAKPTVAGRSHATAHHYVAERFFGRSANRPREQREPIFGECPWGAEGATAVYCYECHEELLHNPVLTAEDIVRFSRLVAARGLAEDLKPEHRQQIAGRIRLLHEALSLGIHALLEREPLPGMRADASQGPGR